MSTQNIPIKFTSEKIILKMKSFKFFTHPDSSAAESSLSKRREGEEGESIDIHFSFFKKSRF